MTHTAHEIHLASRPHGWPTADNFATVSVELPPLGPQQVLVRNTYMSVDPYMRGRMNDVPSYVPPFQVGQVLDGGALGEVIESTDERIHVGDTVVHGYGWRDLAVVDAKRCTVVDPAAVPSPSIYLGSLGMPGLTGYVGLLDIAGMRPGDTVFVSGAAGAVGGMVGQIARLRGAARVVGSAGSAEKVAYLTGKLGFDAAFNYKDGTVRDLLRSAAPDGIDVYFDNVGGDHLTAAIGALRRNGRVAICGMIDQYNATEPVPGPPNMALIIGKRLTLRGFIVSDHAARMPDFLSEATGWLRDGKLVCDETIVEGLDNAPAAFLGLLRGDNIGKMVVKI
jgi:NADPH-dependent curcumin reductase CurA